MTEFLVSRTNPATGIATDRNWQNETFSSQRVPGVNQAGGSASTTAGSASALTTSAPGATQHEINLQEALEWVLGSSQPQDAHLSEDEKEARQARRTELLMWLLNLELRLSPYGDPAY